MLIAEMRSPVQTTNISKVMLIEIYVMFWASELWCSATVCGELCYLQVTGTDRFIKPVLVTWLS